MCTPLTLKIVHYAILTKTVNVKTFYVYLYKGADTKLFKMIFKFTLYHQAFALNLQTFTASAKKIMQSRNYCHECFTVQLKFNNHLSIRNGLFYEHFYRNSVNFKKYIVISRKVNTNIRINKIYL